MGFTGRHLFVNIDASAGELRVEALDRQGKEIPGFGLTLRSGRLYAFWVSPDTSGASRGYVAAGGPGLNALVDR